MLARSAGVIGYPPLRRVVGLETLVQLRAMRAGYASFGKVGCLQRIRTRAPAQAPPSNSSDHTNRNTRPTAIKGLGGKNSSRYSACPTRPPRQCAQSGFGTVTPESNPAANSAPL